MRSELKTCGFSEARGEEALQPVIASLMYLRSNPHNTFHTKTLHIDKTVRERLTESIPVPISLRDGFEDRTG